MGIKLQLPKVTDAAPRLTVIGVGGAGCNAVNNMISTGLAGVDFVVANTDAQALASSGAEHKLQLGATLTEGLGAGSRPEIGEAAAEEAAEEIRGVVAGSHMVFIAAGMGGGTGTGAAAVIARVTRELGILTVGVVTKPFLFEGARRMRVAEAGVAELKKYVDTLIVIPNQNLFRIASEKTTFAEAFIMADQVLYSGISCIVDLIIKEGLINLDFADVRTVMSGMGTAMMGTGEASGERRATLAAEEAIANPLLDDVSLKGAKGLLLSITGGPNLTLYEVDEAASRVREEVDVDANIIVGATFDEKLDDRVRVSIVASGLTPIGEAVRPGEDQRAWMRNARQTGAVTSVASLNVAEAGQPASVPSQLAEDEIRRRLTDALQHDTPAGYGAADPARSAAPAPAREAWNAPGNVTIQVGPPQLPATAYAPPPLPQSRETLSGQDGFAPAPPADVRRPHRRVPDVGDFPAIGQQAYHGRAAPAPSDERSAEAPRKAGLFERITGRSRRESEASADSRGSHSQSVTGSTRTGAPTTHGGATNDGREASGFERQPSDIPVFFNRDRR